MSSMNAAIDYNNHGVGLLQRGEYQKALILLKDAAQLMYATTQEMKKIPGGVQKQARHILGGQPICYTHPCSIPTENLFIRSTALLMSPSKVQQTHSCTLESSIVLLNMALCYHLDCATTNTLPGSLSSALSLYEMTYSLALQIIKEDGRAHDIVLTALNNLGQLHYEMGNFDKSRLYFQDLSTYAIYVAEGGDCVTNSHEFMLNSMVLRNPNNCAGAA